MESQKAELIKLGVPEENIYLETGSATDTIENRPIFFKLKNQLAEKGVAFWVLDLPRDYLENSPSSQLISTALAAIAEFETARRKERQRQGIEAAKAAGKYIGRKTVIDKKLIDQVQDLKENKKLCSL